MKWRPRTRKRAVKRNEGTARTTEVSQMNILLGPTPTYTPTMCLANLFPGLWPTYNSDLILRFQQGGMAKANIVVSLNQSYDQTATLTLSLCQFSSW